MSRENEFWSVKSQGISFQTKSGHPDPASGPNQASSMGAEVGDGCLGNFCVVNDIDFPIILHILKRQ